MNSKEAFIVNGIKDSSTNASYYLGVGYENEPLPLDTPCSDKYDNWCTITNVRRLVGQAQFELSQAQSLEDVERIMFQVSHNGGGCADAFC